MSKRKYWVGVDLANSPDWSCLVAGYQDENGNFVTTSVERIPHFEEAYRRPAVIDVTAQRVEDDPKQIENGDDKPCQTK